MCCTRTSRRAQPIADLDHAERRHAAGLGDQFLNHVGIGEADRLEQAARRSRARSPQKARCLLAGAQDVQRVGVDQQGRQRQLLDQRRPELLSPLRFRARRLDVRSAGARRSCRDIPPRRRRRTPGSRILRAAPRSIPRAHRSPERARCVAAPSWPRTAASHAPAALSPGAYQRNSGACASATAPTTTTASSAIR